MGIAWLPKNVSSFLFNMIGFLGFFAVVIVLTQDAQVFPGAVFSLFSGNTRDPKTLPQGVESEFIETEDGKRIEIWSLPIEEGEPELPYIGVVFHGNGAPLENFLLLQLWFQELGIKSYALDYRGYGKSSGWPTEKGINLDSDAFIKHVLEKEQIDPSRLIILGFSVGSAPAARIASIYHPRLLILAAPFSSATAMIKENPLFRWLAPFAWYKLPTKEYVEALEKTDLLLLHGANDKIVPPHHSLVIKEAYKGQGRAQRLLEEDADHNMVFWKARRELATATTDMLALSR